MGEVTNGDRALAAANTALALVQLVFWHQVESGQIGRDKAIEALQASAARLRRESAPAHQMTADAIDDIIKRLKHAAN